MGLRVEFYIFIYPLIVKCKSEFLGDTWKLTSSPWMMEVAKMKAGKGLLPQKSHVRQTSMTSKNL